jgi:hypothetical protein
VKNRHLPDLDEGVSFFYGFHAVESLRKRRFESRGAAAAAVVNFEMEFEPFRGGWIISGPGADGKFQVHQGSVELNDIPDLLEGAWSGLS